MIQQRGGIIGYLRAYAKKVGEMNAINDYSLELTLSPRKGRDAPLQDRFSSSVLRVRGRAPPLPPEWPP